MGAIFFKISEKGGNFVNEFWKSCTRYSEVDGEEQNKFRWILGLFLKFTPDQALITQRGFNEKSFGNSDLLALSRILLLNIYISCKYK